MEGTTVIRSTLLRLLAACCLSCAWAVAGAETLIVGGTGSSAPLVRLLFDEFRKTEPAATLHLVTPPLGSGGGLKALAEGRINLAVIGRSLKSEERERLGSEATFAETPFVIASSDGLHAGGFSFGQLAAVYTGALSKWDSGRPIRLILRATFESDTFTLRGMSPEMDAAVDQASRRPGMVIGNDDLETLALLTQTPGSLGPTTLGLLTTSGTKAVVFPLNGVTPSVAALKSGAYPWRKAMTAVLPRQPTPLAGRFVAFLRGERARALLLRHDYLPVTP